MTEPTVASAVLQDDGRYLITLSDGATFYTALSSGEEIALLRQILATLGTISGLTGTGSLGAHGGIEVEGVASGTVVPVSAAALPLPTGAATAARQDTGNSSLASIAGTAAVLALESGGNLDALVGALGTPATGAGHHAASTVTIASSAGSVAARPTRTQAVLYCPASNAGAVLLEGVMPIPQGVWTPVEATDAITFTGTDDDVVRVVEVYN